MQSTNTIPVDLSVKQRAEFVATFRWIEVALMEMLAGWIASTPEMEVKVLFGRHVWDCAQHADALGKRTFELRAPLHCSKEPIAEYRQFISMSSKVVGAAMRVSVFYDAILPGLTKKYQGFLSCTDPLMDEPTVRIVENILNDIKRMQQECRELRDEISTMKVVAGIPQDSFDIFVMHQPSGQPHKTEQAIA